MSTAINMLAPYGSLRVRQYNYGWSLGDLPVVKEGDTVRGYYMKAHSGFPAIFEGEPDDRVVVDVIDITALPEEQLRRIDGMEFGCGYFRRAIRTEGGHLAWIYVMPKDQERRFVYDVEEGDWIKWKSTFNQ